MRPAAVTAPGSEAAAAWATAAALLAAGLLAGCGPSALPRTRANVQLCTVLAGALDHDSSAQRLALMTFESSAPVSARLRQDVASYIARTAGTAPDAGAVRRAAAKAESDCAGIGAPVAKGFG
jgi:hypothetical protein